MAKTPNPTQAAAPESKADKSAYRVTSPLRHNGEWFSPGDGVSLSPDEADALQKLGVVAASENVSEAPNADA